MSRWSPTVVPWAKDPWEIQAQVTGQLATGRRLTEFEKRGDIYQEGSDRAQQRLEQIEMPGEARAQQEQDVRMAERGYRPQEYEQGPTGMQGGTVPDATRGLTDEPERTPTQFGPFGHPQRTPGFVPEDQQPLGGQPVPGDVGAQIRLQLIGGGSIAASGQRPADTVQRQATAEMGSARASALREAGVPVGQREQDYMELGGQRPFVQQHEQAGFTGQEQQLDFEYEKNVVSPQVLAAQIREVTSSRDRGPTYQQQLDVLKTQAISLISKYMNDYGVTAQEAWQAQDPAIQDLVSPGEVGTDVYNAGRPGTYSGAAFGQEEGGGILEQQFSPDATDAIRRVENGANPTVVIMELQREAQMTGDDTALRIFKQTLARREKMRLAQEVELGLMLRRQ